MEFPGTHGGERISPPIEITTVFFVTATITQWQPLLAKRDAGDVLIVREIRSRTLSGRIPSGGITFRGWSGEWNSQERTEGNGFPLRSRSAMRL